MSWGDVLIGFAESAEFKAAKKFDVNVAMDFLGLLARSSSQYEYDLFVNAAKMYGVEMLTIGDYLKSSEYRSRFLQ